MKRIFFLLVVLGLVGCSTYRPIPTDAEHKSFRTYVNEAMIADTKRADSKLQHTKTALTNYIEVSLNSLKQRASRSWESADLTTAGGAAAVLGGIADKAGLLNTGLVVAGVGISNSSRYKQDQQVDITLAQFNKLNCMQGRVGMLTQETMNLASKDPAALGAIDSAPEDIIRYVEQVQNAHLAAMYALKANAPTKAELVEYFGRYATATNGGTARSGVTPEELAASKTVRTLAVELEACAKFPA